MTTTPFLGCHGKSRTSELDEQMFLEHRRPRNDRQLLRSLLADGEEALMDHPEADVNHQAPIEVVVASFNTSWQSHSPCWGQLTSWCSKRFNQKFLELAVMKPRDNHLRPPSLTEILDADRNKISFEWGPQIEWGPHNMGVCSLRLLKNYRMMSAVPCQLWFHRCQAINCMFTAVLLTLPKCSFHLSCCGQCRDNLQ